VAFNCDIQGVFRSGIKELEDIESKIRGKIDVLNAELGGSSSGLNFLNGKGGPFTNQLLSKFQNSMAGSLFSDISSMFQNGFSFEKFMDLTIKYLSYRESRARLKREANGLNNDFVYGYTDVMGLVSSDANDIVFLSKISLEEFISEVDERERLVSSVEENIAIALAELDKLDADPTNAYYFADRFGDLKGVSADLLDGLLELNQADLNSAQAHGIIDHSSFQSAKNKVKIAMDRIRAPGTALFNDIAFKNSIDEISRVLTEISEKSEEIIELKTNLCSFIENFEEQYTEFAILRDKAVELQEEIRETKDIVDGFIEKPDTNEISFREDVLARIVAIYIELAFLQQNIIEQFESLKNGTASPEDMENYNKYLAMSSAICSANEDNDQDFYREVQMLLQVEKSKLVANPDSQSEKMRSALDEISARNIVLLDRRPVYISIYNNYDVVENPEMERLMKALKIRGYYQLLQKAMVGDWGGFFSMLGNGMFGLSEFKSLFDCVVKAQQISSGKMSVLNNINSTLDRFKTPFVNPLQSRVEAVERNVKSLENEIKNIGNLKSRAQNSMKT
jgi:regulator of replication initiation timing